MLDQILHETPLFLPHWLLELNLLRAFLWYITGMFLLSLALRLRFYYAIYRIAIHVRRECPSVFRLVNEHWLLCLKNGTVPLISIYIGILLFYSMLNQLVWPLASINIREIAALDVGLLAAGLSMFGIMVGMDLLLVIQGGVVNVREVTANLSLAEYWLGGRLNTLLQFLGKWNPIKMYADLEAREYLAWLNGVFHQSLSSLIVQLGWRLVVAFFLFFCYCVQVNAL